MRVATLDIGTNSILLLVGEQTANGTVRAIREQAVITRLGQGVDQQGTLHPEAIARSLSALRDYAAQMEGLGVMRRAAVGTSALRDAANGAEFSGPAERLLGCPIEVVSGEREADLTLRGVGSTFGPLQEGALVVDVGGGSTELVAAGPDGRRTSLDIGTVRLTERFVASDPPTPAELEAMAGQVRQSLRQLPADLTRVRQLIGVAGTVTTLLTIALGMRVYQSDRVNGGQLSREQVRQLERRLCTLTLTERKSVVGLDPRRADVIVAGAVLVGQVMDQLDVNALDVCDRGVRWGLLLELV